MTGLFVVYIYTCRYAIGSDYILFAQINNEPASRSTGAVEHGDAYQLFLREQEIGWFINWAR